MATDCSLCTFSAPTTGLWLSHLRSVHSQDEDFSITCGLSGCNAQYTKCSSFVSHVYRQHRDVIARAPKSTSSERCGSGNSSLVDFRGLEHCENDFPGGTCTVEEGSMSAERLEHAMDQIMGSDHEKQQKKTALFILSLKEVQGLSQTAVDHVVAECRKMSKHTAGRLEAGINECLARSGIDPNEITGLGDVFASDPFDGLHSTYLQEKFYREKLGCIDPVEIRVGPAKYVTAFSGAKRRKVLKYSTFTYIPVKGTLQSLLQMPDVIREIKTSHASEDGNYHDMCDGKVFETHPIFSTHSHAIQIIAYFDELELCSPLKSNTKKHKLGCIFFTIGNLHPRYRSRLKCIFLVAVARAPVIKAYGIDEFLRPFVDEMKLLESEGLSVSVEGQNQHFMVGFLAFLADTLAAHALGGFKESMSFAYRICRTCMATTEQAQDSFLESQFKMRTPKDHKRHCKLLVGSLRNHYSTLYGVNRTSLLDSFPNFSVVKNLPHDIMHDLFEGIVPYEMKLLIRHCVTSKYFSINTLNDRLKRFDFGYNELSDKPSDLSPDLFKKPDTKIRQSASKMWLLAVILPLLIGDLVPEDCEHWGLYALLLRICCIATAWHISPCTVSYLRVLIEEHHSQFRILYPHSTIIPKMHYMVHYPTQITSFGPLVHTWTMRYEARLSVLKRAARHGNFKNISYTVAKRSQHRLCYHLNCEQPFLADCCVSATSQIQPLVNEPPELSDYIHSLGLCVESHC